MNAVSKSTYRRIGAVVLIVIAVVVIGLIARNNAVVANDDGLTARNQTAGSALPVNTVRVGEVHPDRLERSFAGLLIARRESRLSFDRSGRLATVDREEGDIVKSGDRIAMLEVDDLDATKAGTEAELTAAQAMLDELKAGPRVQTIEAARAKVAQLTAKLELANATERREQNLNDRGAGSLQTLDEAVFARQEMTEQIRSARAELELLVEGTRKEQIAAQIATCESIRGRLQEIEAERRDSQIIAPFDGLVRSRMVDEGVVVTPAMPIVDLISHEVEGRFGLPPESVDSIDVGHTVSVSVRTNRCTGVIARIEPNVDLATRTRAVYVTLRTNDVNHRYFIAGETANLHLEITDESAGVSSTYWLPTTALARGGRGLWAVLVMPGTDEVAVCERRAVELLKSEGDHSLVQGMLQPGDRVIADGLHRITAGMTVSQANASGKSDEPF